MNNSSPQKEMPIARNCSYAGGNGRIITSSASNGPTPTSLKEDQRPYKRVVRYKECLKNHAAAIGGTATDGCGEFMPSGEEGTLEALKCSACNCHRNFHWKEIEGECSSDECYHSPIFLNNGGSKLILGHHNGVLGSPQGYPTNFLIPSRAAPPHHQMIMSNKSRSIPSESDEREHDAAGVVAIRPTEKVKKRFRTKFTQEQKEKLLSFAEEAGWRLQKLEESVVQQFCQEIGIKRRVLKVWMHNNKQSLAKKNSTS